MRVVGMQVDQTAPGCVLTSSDSHAVSAEGCWATGQLPGIAQTAEQRNCILRTLLGIAGSATTPSCCCPGSPRPSPSPRAPPSAWPRCRAAPPSCPSPTPCLAPRTPSPWTPQTWTITASTPSTGSRSARCPLLSEAVYPRSSSWRSWTQLLLIGGIMSESPPMPCPSSHLYSF